MADFASGGFVRASSQSATIARQLDSFASEHKGFMINKNNILLLWGNDEDDINFFSFALREHGYFMESVKSFDECAEFCKNKPPVLLIMRSFLDEPRDGLDFIRKTRTDSSISYFPIIMGWADITHQEKEQGYQEAFDAGANACFGRVFDITDVLEEIKILFNDPTATNVMDRQTIRLQERAKSNK